jgi:putative flippase GtrA
MKRKGFKYIVAGLISWGFDYGTLLLLFYVVGTRLGVATTVAYIIGILINFSLIKYWVFRGAQKTKKATASQGLQYGILTLFNLIITNAVIYLLSKKSIGPEISKILTTALITCWNFVLYKKFIFKETAPDRIV